MPWLTDDAVNYRVAQLAALDNTDGTVRDQIAKQIQQCGNIYLLRIVGHSSPETGNHFILWVFDFSCKEIRIYDSLSLYKNISDDDMALLRNVFRCSGGLQGWTVTFPPQWKQQDSINCGVFVCSAVENEVQHHQVSAEPLTLSQCRTLRLHHASEILKNIDPKDFPPTLKEAIVMEKKESKLQETEQRHGFKYALFGLEDQDVFVSASNRENIGCVTQIQYYSRFYSAKYFSTDTLRSTVGSNAQPVKTGCIFSVLVCQKTGIRQTSFVDAVQTLILTRFCSLLKLKTFLQIQRLRIWKRNCRPGMFCQTGCICGNTKDLIYSSANSTVTMTPYLMM
ncbi:uncharacterized protein LOC103460732 isoform X4 [Poecilia reticulata]|uniref:uncharacterized protein LOC103460732 isoform X4 n=1 Tax=Poecilia reticulata TaxID=8081 RepID=UPI0004A49B25|nr:PREDICTED: uncharacterized protein LOC103460732 isoform X4 [Poecilia reticulata]